MEDSEIDEFASSHPILRQTAFIPHEHILIRSPVPLGKGSFGTVYRGICFFEDVAVKILDEVPDSWNPCGDDDDRREGQFTVHRERSLGRLAAEVEIMQQLSHGNVIGFRGICLNPPCIVTELCERGSLYDLIGKDRSRNHLTLERRLEIAAGAAKGMGYLHLRSPSIIHMDLKSPNLLLTKNWEVKVADFGLSKFLHNTEGCVSPQNPMWLAPEVLNGGDPTIESDIYPFGIILWELLTLKKPWTPLEDDCPPELLNISMNVLLHDARPEIPEKIAEMLGGHSEVFEQYIDLMKRCWVGDPVDRPSYQTIVEELWGMIRDIRGEEHESFIAQYPRDLAAGAFLWSGACRCAAAEMNGNIEVVAREVRWDVPPEQRPVHYTQEVVAHQPGFLSGWDTKEKIRAFFRIGNISCFRPKVEEPSGGSSRIPQQIQSPFQFGPPPSTDVSTSASNNNTAQPNSSAFSSQPTSGSDCARRCSEVNSKGSVGSTGRKGGRNRIRTARLSGSWIPANLFGKKKNKRGGQIKSAPSALDFFEPDNDPKGVNIFKTYPSTVCETNIFPVGSAKSITSSAELPNEIVVQEGDTLPKLCQKFRVNIQEMLQMNPHIEDPVELRVGERLVLPPESTSGVVKVAGKLLNTPSGLKTELCPLDIMGRSPSSRKRALIDAKKVGKTRKGVTTLMMVDNELPSEETWAIIRDYVVTQVKWSPEGLYGWNQIVLLADRNVCVPDVKTWKQFQGLFFDTNTEGFRHSKHWRVLKSHLVKDIVPVLQD